MVEIVNKEVRLIKFKKIGKYNISSIRYSDEEISVYTGFIGSLPSKKNYIINEFRYDDDNREIFRELFLYFLSNPILFGLLLAFLSAM